LFGFGAGICTSPPELLGVPRWVAPLFGMMTQETILPSAVVIVLVVRGVTPVPLAPLVVLRPVNRLSGFVAELLPVDSPTPTVVLLAFPAVGLPPLAVPPLAVPALAVIPPVEPELAVVPERAAVSLGGVAPKVAVTPVPVSVRPVAPVVLAIPGADAASGEPLVTPAGQAGRLLTLLVVCCAPAEAASTTAIAKGAVRVRHRMIR